MVTGNVTIAGNANAAIRTSYEKARAVAVTAPAGSDASGWAYTDFGRRRNREAGTRRRSRNRARHVQERSPLNLKKTDFEADRIAASVRVGTGGITEPPSQRGLRGVAAGTFIPGGLGRHSADDLRELLAGKNVGWSFGADWDAFDFRGTTTPADLALQLQLLTAYLTDPGYRPEALRVARKGMEQAYVSFRHTPNGPLATEIANLLASGDPRFGLPAEQELLSRNLEEVKAWLEPQFADGAVEIALVGISMWRRRSRQSRRRRCTAAPWAEAELPELRGAVPGAAVCEGLPDRLRDSERRTAALLAERRRDGGGAQPAPERARDDPERSAPRESARGARQQLQPARQQQCERSFSRLRLFLGDDRHRTRRRRAGRGAGDRHRWTISPRTA
jgi:hypothetical protein